MSEGYDLLSPVWEVHESKSDQTQLGWCDIVLRKSPPQRTSCWGSNGGRKTRLIGNHNRLYFIPKKTVLYSKSTAIGPLFFRSHFSKNNNFNIFLVVIFIAGHGLIGVQISEQSEHKQNKVAYTAHVKYPTVRPIL